MKILERFIDKFLCKHKWEHIKHTIIVSDGFFEVTGTVTGHLDLYCCKECGKFKKVRT